MKQVLRLLTCLLLPCVPIASSYGQVRTITGKVRSAIDQSPIAGATVSVKGSGTATSTDSQGNYSLTVTKGTLIFAAIGYEKREISVGNRNTLTVDLKPSAFALSEVVVTGYGNQNRSTFAGSVAKVTDREITGIPMPTFDQLLQGRAAGLYVTAGSGQPGTSARVTIRGIGSISGTTAPLYILDGVPIEESQFSTINPNDLASVDVLKDAVATAIYGSRGSNGVIVLNSKRGAAGAIIFGASTQFGISNRTRPKFEVLNSAQRIQFEEEVGLENKRDIGPGWRLSDKNPANANLSTAEKARNAAALDSLRNANVDWADIFFRRGSYQQHELNASGGNENLRFYSSLNYLDQEGIALHSSLERYTFRNNLDFSNKKFSASLNTSFGYSQSRFIAAENSTAVVNPFAAIYYALPYEQPYINGKLISSGNLTDASYDILDYREGSNALERVQNAASRDNQFKGTINIRLRYQITDDLNINTLLGIDFRETKTSKFINPDSYSGRSQEGKQGLFGEGLSRNLQLVSSSGLQYAKMINDRHEIDVQGIFELTRQRYRTFNYTGYGINPKLPETPAGITPGSASGFIPDVDGGRTENLLVSLIGIARYTLDKKYSLNASYRYDGTSTIPEVNRWKGFYSVGANWNMKQENFFAENAWLDGLRLRVSYGLTASPFAGNFSYLSTYSSTKYAGATGIYPSAPGNAAYDWEYTRQADIGVEAEFWNNRIRAVVDIYNKDTENLFINQSLSATSGFSRLNVNAGSLYNRGLEVDLQVDVIRNQDFTWTFGSNFNLNKNKITDLGDVSEFINGTSIIRVGLPIGSHYIPKWGGVDAATGDPLYYKQDGTLTKTYDATSQSVAAFGSYQPKFQGGFNTSVNYKGLHIGALFTFADQVTRFNNEDFFNENATFGTSNQSTLVLNRWRQAGDITNVQRYGSTRQFSSKDLQDASYLRLRNFTISYSLPKSLLQRSGFIQRAQLILQAQNLFTWTSWRGFDPEDNNNIATFEYPNARTYTFGLNLNF